jgi:hypothetical protein
MMSSWHFPAKMSSGLLDKLRLVYPRCRLTIVSVQAKWLVRGHLRKTGLVLRYAPYLPALHFLAELNDRVLNAYPNFLIDPPLYTLLHLYQSSISV